MAHKNEDRSMFAILFILGIAIVGAIIYGMMSNKAGDSSLVGADEDEHGCKASAGYSWCASKEKCLRTWEEECPSNESGAEFVYLTDLKNKILAKNSAVEISEVKSDSFDWVMNDAGMILADGKIGYSLKMKNIDSDLLAGIKTEIIANGFAVNEYNVTAGTAVARNGYEREDLICLLNEEVLNVDSVGENISPLYRAEIYCAAK